MWDINSAYLHGMINHNIYVAFPDGYEKPGKVGKPNKALYGLPEATWIWHEDLKEKLSHWDSRLLEVTPVCSWTSQWQASWQKTHM